MNMMIFIGMCVFSTAIIGGYFIHLDTLLSKEIFSDMI